LPKASRPSGDYAKFARVLRAWILDGLVKERVAEMRRNGERPEGGCRAQALKEITRKYANDINTESLVRALARARRLRRLLARRKRRASER
jgi:hypothetical protein